MKEYIIELSRYINLFVFSLYVFFSFLTLSIKNKNKRDILYDVQVGLILILQLVCFLDISVVKNDVKILFLYGFIQLLLVVTLFLTTIIYEFANRQLLNNMCMLLGIGLVEISRFSISDAIRQGIIGAVAIFISLFIPFGLMHIKFLRKIRFLYAGLGIFLLSAVLLLGQLTHGSKLTISIASLTFQPSEFVKILFVLFLASSLWLDNSLENLVLTAILSAAFVIVLVLSKDLGGALIFYVCFTFVVFLATGNYLHVIFLILFGMLSSYASYYLFDHVKTRILAWLDPFSYIDSMGYQITQSLFAISSGGFFGMGLCQGNPEAIPYVKVDFIFSAICEENGLLFGIFLILLCLNTFIAIIQLAMKINDRFYQLITYGLSIVYIFQVFLTIGGDTKFIPLTGVTLPFISYGGSSLTVSIIMFFIIQGISIRLNKEDR